MRRSRQTPTVSSAGCSKTTRIVRLPRMHDSIWLSRPISIATMPRSFGS